MISIVHMLDQTCYLMVVHYCRNMTFSSSISILTMLSDAGHAGRKNGTSQKNLLTKRSRMEVLPATTKWSQSVLHRLKTEFRSRCWYV